MDESTVLTIFADGADDTHAVFQVIAAHAGAAVPLPRSCAGVAGRITPAGTIIVTALNVTLSPMSRLAVKYWLLTGLLDISVVCCLFCQVISHTAAGDAAPLLKVISRSALITCFHASSWAQGIPSCSQKARPQRIWNTLWNVHTETFFLKGFPLRMLGSHWHECIGYKNTNNSF